MFLIHEGCLNLFHRGLCSPIHVLPLCLSLLFCWSVCCFIICHIFKQLYVICLYLSYGYIVYCIYIYENVISYVSIVRFFSCPLSGAFFFSRMRCWRHATTCNWPSLRHGLSTKNCCGSHYGKLRKCRVLQFYTPEKFTLEPPKIDGLFSL